MNDFWIVVLCYILPFIVIITIGIIIHKRMEKKEEELKKENDAKVERVKVQLKEVSSYCEYGHGKAEDSPVYIVDENGEIVRDLSYTYSDHHKKYYIRKNYRCPKCGKEWYVEKMFAWSGASDKWEFYKEKYYNR